MFSPMLKKPDPPDENARNFLLLTGDLQKMNHDSTTFTLSLSAHTMAAIFSTQFQWAVDYDNAPIDLDCRS